MIKTDEFLKSLALNAALGLDLEKRNPFYEDIKSIDYFANVLSHLSDESTEVSSGFNICFFRNMPIESYLLIPNNEKLNILSKIIVERKSEDLPHLIDVCMDFYEGKLNSIDSYLLDKLAKISKTEQN